jgi:hypothetical protein
VLFIRPLVHGYLRKVDCSMHISSQKNPLYQGLALVARTHYKNKTRKSGLVDVLAITANILVTSLTELTFTERQAMHSLTILVKKSLFWSKSVTGQRVTL